MHVWSAEFKHQVFIFIMPKSRFLKKKNSLKAKTWYILAQIDVFKRCYNPLKIRVCYKKCYHHLSLEQGWANFLARGQHLDMEILWWAMNAHEIRGWGVGMGEGSRWRCRLWGTGRWD